MDWQAKRLEGKVFTVRLIDSAGQIHLEETGIALLPGVVKPKCLHSNIGNEKEIPRTGPRERSQLYISI